jgi:hypothetical protein
VVHWRAAAATRPSAHTLGGALCPAAAARAGSIARLGKNDVISDLPGTREFTNSFRIHTAAVKTPQDDCTSMHIGFVNTGLAGRRSTARRQLGRLLTGGARYLFTTEHSCTTLSIHKWGLRGSLASRNGSLIGRPFCVRHGCRVEDLLRPCCILDKKSVALLCR